MLIFVSYSVINYAIGNNRVDSWKISGVILTIFFANEKYEELDLKTKYTQGNDIYHNFRLAVSYAKNYNSDKLTRTSVRISHNNEWDYVGISSLKTSEGETYDSNDLKATLPPSNPSSQYSSGKLGDSFKSFAWSLAKSAVKESLKAPSTAKFPSSHNGQDIKQTDANTFIVNSYVDAQNSYGAMIRSNFSVTIKKTGSNSYTVENVHIDQ